MSLLIALTGLVSLIAAFELVREGYLLAAEGRTPSCDINPFFSCGSVMESWQARVALDAPNQLFGVAGYAVVTTIGVAMAQGARFQRWFWQVTTAGLLAAWLFLMWLFVQAVFAIGILCLYCMVVWVAHTILWWIFLPWAMREKLIADSPTLSRWGATLLPYSWVPIAITFAVITLSIYVQFPLLFPF